MPPIERFLNALTEHGFDPTPCGDGWSARCPAHDDHNPSLSVSESDDGRVLIYCHAGCSAKAVCVALDYSISNLMSDGETSKARRTTRKTTAMKPKKKSSPRPKTKIAATHDYRDENDELLLQIVRLEPKGFRQRRPTLSGGWEWSVAGVRIVVYRLSRLLAKPKQCVAIVEGEKDVDSLASIGVLATCNAGGAGKWKPEHSEFLRGRDVAILPDNDAPGRKHAQQVAKSLHGLAISIRIIELPNLPEKGDASDWIEAGGTKQELEKLIDLAPLWTPAAAPLVPK
jgi:putative DNA primase/helicase